MGLLPVGESKRSQRLSPASEPSTPVEIVNTDVVLMVRVQVAFLVCGAFVGVLGIVLPHPETFLTKELLLLNCGSWLIATISWFGAARVTPAALRLMPGAGTLLITASVIFSRDPTSAYTLLYLFPCVYAYYFLNKTDAALHIAFAALNYGAAILFINSMADAPELPSGSVLHHFVITVGSLIVVGAMLLFLRRRVEVLMEKIVDSARTDLLTGLHNTRGAMQVLSAELERARMGAHRVTVLNIYVGGLRASGSRIDQQTADGIIKDAAQLLDDSTRRIDTVGRTAASEYVVILPETDESTGFLLAEQILARFRRTFRERGITLATAIGIASFPKHAAGAEDLMQSAEAATEAARAMGSDRAVVFSAELEEVVSGDPSRTLTERRTHMTTVLSLAQVLDLHDDRTTAHSLAVGRYAELIATRLGLPEARIQRLRLAGMLHDIGKVGIPDSIFAKPGPLSPGEWDQVRRHPELAARILGAPELTDIREWILKRHEQPDGHGYPRGLSGDAIPIESRILAVAETYDALTSKRPYRPARSRDEAIEELGRYVGSQFDGAVVDALLAVLDTPDQEPEISR